MSKILTAIGLMSGTSMDGIDAAIIRTDGTDIHQISDKHSIFTTLPYADDFKKSLKEVVRTGENITDVERELTLLHADAVKQLLEKAHFTPDEIDVIGFHGHTIDHRPDDVITVQIGDGNLLAELTEINVENDFRSADVNAGGQGAPLVPLYHRALFKEYKKPIAVLNIGGVANITYLGKNDKISGFDTGSGNALLDDWIFAHTGEYFDKNGEIASKGKPDEKILEILLSDEYFKKPPPKSLDRDYFHIPNMENLSVENGAATLTAFTVQSVKKSYEFLSKTPKQCYVTGGGRHNVEMMNRLQHELLGEVLKIENAGFDGDAIEAEAFAFLAVRRIYDLPITLPEITGAIVSK